MTVHQVFVYGELTKKGRLLHLFGRDPLAFDATLRGYERTLNPETGRVIAVEKEGAWINGRLLTGISDRELLILDEYKGITENMYEKVLVEVEMQGGRATAYLYVKKLEDVQ